MTEYEIIYLISQHTDRVWNIMQFWSSISFGLIIVAYIAAAKLNWPIIVIITCIYIVFSLFILNMLKINGGMSDSYIMDLQHIIDTGKILSNGAQSLIDVNSQDNKLVLIISAFAGTFFSAIFFLWYSYFSKRNITSNSSPTT